MACANDSVCLMTRGGSAGAIVWLRQDLRLRDIELAQIRGRLIPTDAQTAERALLLPGACLVEHAQDGRRDDCRSVVCAAHRRNRQRQQGERSERAVHDTFREYCSRATRRTAACVRPDRSATSVRRIREPRDGCRGRWRRRWTTSNCWPRPACFATLPAPIASAPPGPSRERSESSRRVLSQRLRTL